MLRCSTALFSKPDAFDGWLLDLWAIAEEGTALLMVAWVHAPIECCAYLLTMPDTFAEIKARAVWADAKKADDAKGQ